MIGDAYVVAKQMQLNEDGTLRNELVLPVMFEEEFGSLFSRVTIWVSP